MTPLTRHLKRRLAVGIATNWIGQRLRPGGSEAGLEAVPVSGRRS